jgi:hypothetical protein
VVDAAQRDKRGRTHILLLEDEHRGHLRQRFDGQDGRHDRRARKVAREKVLVDREVLECGEPGARLMLPDRVDQKRWITVINAVEERGKV